ncbi:alpha/beta hydrolase [Blastomonas sp.]|uniref:alpha/beta hydrolase n=1 Tax=Blastomonas sp. TaxID=1909299 RepID=UPI0035941D58
MRTTIFPLRHLSLLLAALMALGSAAQANVPRAAETLIIDAAAFATDDAWGAQPSMLNASFGPFIVVDAHTVELHGLIDSESPSDFAAMLAGFPAIRTLRMVECPGSADDDANLALARMVRAARIETVVPAGGSVRSGAVELFLAGVRRSADSRAEFVVHSWRDENGREAADYAADDPVHRAYLDFYSDMGLSLTLAARFYALTNSVPFAQTLSLAPADLAGLGMLEVI